MAEAGLQRRYEEGLGNRQKAGFLGIIYPKLNFIGRGAPQIHTDKIKVKIGSSKP